MSAIAIASRTLGGTNLPVTTLGLGGAPIGGFRFAFPEQQGVGTVRAAYAAGVRYFDTSPYYGYGRSEHIFGQALRVFDRNSFVLSTKVGRTMAPKGDNEDVAGWRAGGLLFKPTFDYSRDGAFRSLEQSYLRLGLNRIDIALIHDVDVWTHGSQVEADRRFKEAINGCYPALVELRKAGIVRSIGVGLNECAMSLRFAREADIDCIMLAGRYTLLEQGALDELLPTCRAKDISVLMAGPLNSGILGTGAVAGASYDYKPAPPHIIEKVRRLEAICTAYGIELATAALQFPLGHPSIASVVVGAIHADEVRQNVARFATRIPTELWEQLKRENLISSDAPIPACLP